MFLHRGRVAASDKVASAPTAPLPFLDGCASGCIERADLTEKARTLNAIQA